MKSNLDKNGRVAFLQGFHQTDDMKTDHLYHLRNKMNTFVWRWTIIYVEFENDQVATYNFIVSHKM